MAPHEPALPIARLLEGAPAARVRQPDARPHLAQAELDEGVLRAQPHRLAGVAPPPLALVPDHDAALGVAVAPVDLLEHGGADELAALPQDDRPEHPVRILRRLPEVVLLLAQGQRVAVREVARDLHVREPPLVERGVLEPGRLEPDARALDDGTVHGRTTLSRGAYRPAPRRDPDAPGQPFERDADPSNTRRNRSCPPRKHPIIVAPLANLRRVSAMIIPGCGPSLRALNVQEGDAGGPGEGWRAVRSQRRPDLLAPRRQSALMGRAWRPWPN